MIVLTDWNDFVVKSGLLDGVHKDNPYRVRHRSSRCPVLDITNSDSDHVGLERHSAVYEGSHATKYKRQLSWSDFVVKPGHLGGGHEVNLGVMICTVETSQCRDTPVYLSDEMSACTGSGT